MAKKLMVSVKKSLLSSFSSPFLIKSYLHLDYFIKEDEMMNILIYPIMILYAILGGGSTIAITGYLLIVLAQKIARKIKYGASLYD